nr:glycosyltransferase [Oryzomonas rubra]
MPAVSLIICSHNAPASLDDTLTSILEQCPLSTAELVLVNNGFNEQRVDELSTRLNGYIAFTIVSEPVPGLGFARRRGFAEARGDYFVLLDDDNTLASGFIASLLDIVERYPGLGGLCPLVEPDWKVTPPEWLQDFGRLCLSYNAAGRFRPAFSEKYWAPEKDATWLRPPGGGMIISRKVAEYYLAVVRDPARLALARRPDSLVGCEDEDIFAGVAKLRMGVVFSEQLKVFHHISAIRVTMKYLTRLNYQMLHSYGTLYAMTHNDGAWRCFGGALRCLEKSFVTLFVDFFQGKMRPQRLFLEMVRAVGYFVGRIS